MSDVNENSYAARHDLMANIRTLAGALLDALEDLRRLQPKDTLLRRVLRKAKGLRADVELWLA